MVIENLRAREPVPGPFQVGDPLIESGPVDVFLVFALVVADDGGLTEHGHVRLDDPAGAVAVAGADDVVVLERDVADKFGPAHAAAFLLPRGRGERGEPGFAVFLPADVGGERARV
jgi:hypothetical protein